MKTNSLILLASLAVLATNASAAHSQLPSNMVVLPTYVVNAPRFQPAEQKVIASLNELRQLAAAPVRIAAKLPLLTEPVMQPENLAKAAHDARIRHVAKI